jgi:hypothetical protein
MLSSDWIMLDNWLDKGWHVFGGLLSEAWAILDGVGSPEIDAGLLFSLD